jgi:hypothetical protein
MLVVVKIILLAAGLAVAGMVVGYRRLLKALAAVGVGALMLYGFIFGVWLYVSGFVWRQIGGMLIAAVAGAAVGLMSGWRTGFVVFGLVLAVSYVALPLVGLFL